MNEPQVMLRLDSPVRMLTEREYNLLLVEEGKIVEEASYLVRYPDGLARYIMHKGKHTIVSNTFPFDLEHPEKAEDEALIYVLRVLGMGWFESVNGDWTCIHCNATAQDNKAANYACPCREGKSDYPVPNGKRPH